MAPLPECRVTSGMYAFESVEFDYFCPIYFKKDRSVVKHYGCLFACFKSRTIHLEVDRYMTTDSFLMTFTRLVNRRTPPRKIYSGNGTKFVGADVNLQRSLISLSQSVISDTLMEREVQWNFIPPAANHHEGVWKRLICSVKSVLRAVVSEQTANNGCFWHLLQKLSVSQITDRLYYCVTTWRTDLL